MSGGGQGPVGQVINQTQQAQNQPVPSSQPQQTQQPGQPQQPQQPQQQVYQPQYQQPQQQFGFGNQMGYGYRPQQYQQPQYQPQQQYGGYGNYGGYNPYGGGIMGLLGSLFGGYGGGFGGGYNGMQGGFGTGTRLPEGVNPNYRPSSVNYIGDNVSSTNQNTGYGSGLSAAQHGQIDMGNGNLMATNLGGGSSPFAAGVNQNAPQGVGQTTPTQPIGPMGPSGPGTYA